MVQTAEAVAAALEQKKRKRMLRAPQMPSAVGNVSDAAGPSESQSRAGSGRQRMLKSRYKEDAHPVCHTSVWGSWYDVESGKWGFVCCRGTSRKARCPHAAEKDVSEKKASAVEGKDRKSAASAAEGKDGKSAASAAKGKDKKSAVPGEKTAHDDINVTAVDGNQNNNVGEVAVDLTGTTDAVDLTGTTDVLGADCVAGDSDSAEEGMEEPIIGRVRKKKRRCKGQNQDPPTVGEVLAGLRKKELLADDPPRW